MTMPANDDNATLPLGLQPPRVVSDINIRFAHRPPEAEDDQKIIALGATVTGLELATIAAKLPRGKVEITITNGFGWQRTMSLSPAELFFLLAQGQRFVEEFPR